MRYRVNGKKNDPYREFSKGSIINPLQSTAPVIVVTDGSKTNTCLVVGTVFGKILSYYELSGKGMDTTDFCEELEEFYMTLLKDVNIEKMGQEEIITKKTKDNKPVLGYMIANKVLTELRSHLITIARKLTGQNPEELNNKRWKRRTLPDGYRGNDEKGSYRYLSSLSEVWVNVKDDVTDAVCMYTCMVMDYEKENPIYCDCSENVSNPRSFALMDVDYIDTTNSKKFIYNPSFSVEDNAKYFMNRVEGGGYSIIDINTINYADIFKHVSFMATPKSVLCLYISAS